MNPFNPGSFGCLTGTFCAYPRPEPSKPTPETHTEVAVKEPSKAPPPNPNDPFVVLLFVVILLAAISGVLAILFNSDN